MNIEEILKKHVDEEGKLDQEAAAKELKEVQGKEFVPKADFNSKNEELKTANETINTLQKENKDVESLQTTINDYKSQIEQLETERAEERKAFAIKEALQTAGAQDVDYMMFKLGDVEVDEDGSIKDLDNKIKELQESNPTFFAAADSGNEEDEGGPNPPAGFSVLDNKLDGGKPSDPLETATAEFEQALGITQE